MCLDLTTNINKQTATKDIVCYKRVVIDHKSLFTLHTKKSFTGIIKGIQCKGKIQVVHNHVYFCTNELALDGSPCMDKLGYEYSWAFDSHVKKVMVDEVDLMNVNIYFTTPYRGAMVKLGETYTSELIRTQLDTIEIGLHSFTTYYAARYDGVGVVVKCIIPKGAGYYEGLFIDDKSYASNQLKYVEVVEE